MSTIYIESTQKDSEVLFLVKSAVESEIARLELAEQAARSRLAPFEQKYGVSSDYFMVEMTAEDLEDKDDEYVRWAGEYRLMQGILKKLQQLREIDYGDPGLLQKDQGSD